MINIVTHTFEVFKVPNIILKDTPIVEKLSFQPIILVQDVDTIGEQLVDDLAIRIKQVFIND